VLSFRLKEINRIKHSLEKCDIKSYYIQATDDYLVPAKSLEEFKLLFSNLNIYRVNGAHFILQSNPVKCTKIIENIIR
jgi:pimeloyl-ACP methyl ester carboxylesterase